MITSMTGYGHGEAVSEGIAASVEIRSVNGRYFEIVPRLPRSMALRENELRELVRRRVLRGKMTLTVTVERDANGPLPLKVDVASAKAYYRLLNDLRKAVRLKQTVRLEHLLQFSDVFKSQDLDSTEEKEWEVVREALDKSLDALLAMRTREGEELQRDFDARLAVLSDMIEKIEQLSREQVPRERERLRERIAQILEREPVDEGRLEMELAILADRLDVTEECVRFRSHVGYFRQAMASPEAAGRKLNFLIQEMNREMNTMGSKSSDAAIAHLVVEGKEELEKVREQLQNIE
jgi:uncharacterized protein (TIGR00255 family)